jgi:hypothetical protein
MVLAGFLLLSVPFSQKAGEARTLASETPSGKEVSDNRCEDFQQLKHPEAEDSLEIFLLIGQSNMAGRADLETYGKDTLDRVFLYTGKEGNEWDYASGPLNRYSTVRKELAMQKLGPGNSFAREMADAMPDNRIGLVVNARGGTSIDEWAPGSDLYIEALQRAGDASKFGAIRGIIWHQGESDVSRSEQYMDKLVHLITSFRQDLGLPGLPFVAGQLSEDKPERAVFNRMLLSLPSRLPFTAVISSEGTSTFDQTHFDAASQNLLGIRYAAEIKSLIGLPESK